MDALHTVSTSSPMGPLQVSERSGSIVRVTWGAEVEAAPTPLLEEALSQLKAYFDGRLTVFDLPLAPRGSPFQQSVYAQLRAIPFGETRTYGQLAENLESFGQPVGQACGSNTIAVIIPCHRMLSAHGTGGFSAIGGVETKIELLRHEDSYPYLL